MSEKLNFSQVNLTDFLLKNINFKMLRPLSITDYLKSSSNRLKGYFDCLKGSIEVVPAVSGRDKTGLKL